MQYTGLKFDGKEVYEGDIIDTFDPVALENNRPSDIRGVIVYRESAGYFFLEVNNEFYKLLTNLETPKVIGNIYENPELSKGGE